MRRPSVPPTPNATKPVVLIVDSDESFGTLLQHFLERLGYRALRLPEPRYALRLLRELEVDLLITTLDGEQGEGLELLIGLGSERERPPVLLCTRHPGSSPAMAAATSALGVSEVLPRPCRFDVIADAVERLVARSPEARRSAS
jgi:DNA-binding NtrC family response regulator